MLSPHQQHSTYYELLTIFYCCHSCFDIFKFELLARVHYYYISIYI